MFAGEFHHRHHRHPYSVYLSILAGRQRWPANNAAEHHRNHLTISIISTIATHSPWICHSWPAGEGGRPILALITTTTILSFLPLCFFSRALLLLHAIAVCAFIMISALLLSTGR
jgi:hypothetical protein